MRQNFCFGNVIYFLIFMRFDLSTDVESLIKTIYFDWDISVNCIRTHGISWLSSLDYVINFNIRKLEEKIGNWPLLIVQQTWYFIQTLVHWSWTRIWRMSSVLHVRKGRQWWYNLQNGKCNIYGSKMMRLVR